MCLVSPLHKLLQIVSFLLDSFIELKSQGRHEGVKHTLIHVYIFPNSGIELRKSTFFENTECWIS